MKRQQLTIFNNEQFEKLKATQKMRKQQLQKFHNFVSVMFNLRKPHPAEHSQARSKFRNISIQINFREVFQLKRKIFGKLPLSQMVVIKQFLCFCAFPKDGHVIRFLSKTTES